MTVTDTYLLDVASNRLTKLADGFGRMPSVLWSPDGNLIAFTSDRDGTDALYTMRPDGTTITKISAKAPFKSIGSPSWAPDGSRIAVQATCDPARFDLYDLVIFGLDGAFINVTTCNGRFIFPLWSPAR